MRGWGLDRTNTIGGLLGEVLKIVKNPNGILKVSGSTTYQQPAANNLHTYLALTIDIRAQYNLSSLIHQSGKLNRPCRHLSMKVDVALIAVRRISRVI